MSLKTSRDCGGYPWRALAVAMVIMVVPDLPGWGQTPGLPNPSVPADFSAVAEGVATSEAPFLLRPPASETPLVPSYFAREGGEPYGPEVVMGPLATIGESLFGDPYAEGRWRPLSLRTFFTEGWLEPWAGAPAGREGLTPRHGWLGAFDGVFYRLWFTTFTYSNNLSTPYGGNRYTGNYSIFVPLSRRFDLFMNVPFVWSNGTLDSTRGYTSQFGDLIVTPRFLLSESVATTQVLNLGFRAPTGTTQTGNGVLWVNPEYQFWTNPVGPWVVRGSAGFNVPLNKNQASAETLFSGGIAAGRYFTPHDVPFGDFVLYGACNFAVPLDGGATRDTVVTVGPGTRFHLANNWFFLHYWDFPVTGNGPNDYTMQVALMKVF